MNLMQSRPYASRKKEQEEELKRRLDAEFSRQELLGDTNLSEYERQYLVRLLHSDVAHQIRIIRHNAPIQIQLPKWWCVGLVQLGIGEYETSFHQTLEQTLDIDDSESQALVRSCYHTMEKQDKKLALNDKRKLYVRTILMHAFVPNSKAAIFFDFLRKDIYEKLLNRNISCLSEQDGDDNGQAQLSLLWEEFKELASESKLSCSTVLACDYAPYEIRQRLHLYLRAIDSRFWNEPLDSKTASKLESDRLYEFFKNMCNEREQEEDFRSSHQGRPEHAKRTRQYTSPYLHYDRSRGKLTLRMPEQMYSQRLAPQSCQLTVTCGDTVVVDQTLYTSLIRSRNGKVFGYRVAGSSFDLNFNRDLFSPIKIVLSAQETGQHRVFYIKEQPVRFFQADGTWVDMRYLPEGFCFAWSRAAEGHLQSDAIRSIQPNHLFEYTEFNFEQGDVVRLPNGAGAQIGARYAEGLTHYGLQQDCVAYPITAPLPQNPEDGKNNEVPLYRQAPTICFGANDAQLPGTMIMIDDQLFHLFDNDTNKGRQMHAGVTVCEKRDGQGEKWVAVKISKFLKLTDGIHSVLIDVPNDRKERFWTFAYLGDFVCTPANLNEGDHVFDLRITTHSQAETRRIEVDPDDNYARFSWENMIVGVPTPFVSHRWGEGTWCAGFPEAIWHADLPGKLALILPQSFGNDLEIQLVGERREYLHSFPVTKTPGQSCFKLDLTPFKSYLTRQHAKCTVKLYSFASSTSVDCFDIITKSQLTSVSYNYDYGCLQGTFAVLGRSQCAVDILCVDKSGKVLLRLEKELLTGETLEFPIDPQNSREASIETTLWELDDDEFGLGGEWMQSHKVSDDSVRFPRLIEYDKDAYLVLTNTICFTPQNKRYNLDLTSAATGREMCLMNIVRHGPNSTLSRYSWEYDAVLQILGRDGSFFEFPVIMRHTMLSENKVELYRYDENGEKEFCYYYPSKRRILPNDTHQDRQAQYLDEYFTVRYHQGAPAKPEPNPPADNIDNDPQP